MAHYTPHSQSFSFYAIPQDILQDPQTQNMNMPDGYAPDMNANEWYLSDAGAWQSHRSLLQCLI